MSKSLTHFIVGAYVEETESVGFFLVPRSYKGVEVSENWNMVGMRAKLRAMISCLMMWLFQTTIM